MDIQTIVIVGILGLLAFWIFSTYKKFTSGMKFRRQMADEGITDATVCNVDHNSIIGVSLSARRIFILYLFNLKEIDPQTILAVHLDGGQQYVKSVTPGVIAGYSVNTGRKDLKLTIRTTDFKYEFRSNEDKHISEMLTAYEAIRRIVG